MSFGSPKEQLSMDTARLSLRIRCLIRDAEQSICNSIFCSYIILLLYHITLYYFL